LCSSAVAEVRRRQPAVLVEVKVPQWHPPGAEAEVDFGQVGFWLDGVLTDAWMFVFRLSASGKGFHRVYLNQAQQAFLDGHVILKLAGPTATARRRWCPSVHWPATTDHCRPSPTTTSCSRPPDDRRRRGAGIDRGSHP
jgi:hypothetical protein